MIPINQTIREAPRANCFQACVASYLECDLVLVPNFILRNDWLDEFIKFINYQENYSSTGFHWGLPPYDDKYHIGYYEVNDRYGHAVIVLNGEVVHDPIGSLRKSYTIEGYFNISKN